MAIFAPRALAAPAPPTHAEIGGAAAQDAPGGYEIVWQHGRQLFGRAQGFADLENHVPIAGDSVFRIASLTKQFTAVAVLTLIQDGKLSLDDAVGKRFPGCPPRWRDITIGQLLSHTSGITGDFAPLAAHHMEDLTPRELLGLYSDRPVEAKPGTQWAYSNVNYWLLGLVIETLTGEPYQNYVRRRVLEPAGLHDTRYSSYEEIISRRAKGYVNSGGQWRNAPYFSETLSYSAGAFLSTPRDMAQWYEALSQGRIVSRKLLDLALTPARTMDGKVTRYGLGWFASEFGGHRAGSHGGTSVGFTSYVIWIPDLDLFVGKFQNCDGAEPKAAAEGLLRETLASKAAKERWLGVKIVGRRVGIQIPDCEIAPAN
jgi:CubicO group peptidase (beta-lactamase class C family)